MRRLIVCSILAFGLGFSIHLSGQAKPSITRADYGQWETLAAGGGGRGAGATGGFSPDGRWVAYTITRVNRSNELRLLKLADQSTKVVPNGSQATFSPDSQWAAYTIGRAGGADAAGAGAPAAGARGGRGGSDRLGIMSLATGEVATVEGIQSFAFSPDGAYLAMRRVNPEPAAAPAAGAATRGGGGGRGAGGGRGGGADTGDEPVGATVIVRQLSSGHDTTFGNVGEMAWQDDAHTHRLAIAVSAPDKIGNGVQVFDPATGALRVLESSASSYTDLAWRKDSADLAVLRAKTDPRRDGPTEVVLAWSGVGASDTLRSFDPSTAAGFPAGMRTVPFRRLAWSDDGKTIFFGIAAWDEALPTAAPGRGGRGRGSNAGNGGGSTTGDGAGGSAVAPDEPAGVDIWHWTDIFVQPRQKLSAAADRRRNLLAAWHLDSNAFAQLGRTYDESVTPLRHENTAYLAEWSKYDMDRTIGRPAADLYLEDEASSTRTQLVDDVNDRDAQVGPADKYLLFLRDDAFWTVNLATRAVTNITKGVPAQFIDKESDETIAQKPAFGVGGWTKDDAGVLLYDTYDIWVVPSDGTGKARRLTDGTAEGVRHRLVRVGQDDEAIDLAKPVYVSLFGLHSKKSGYGVVKPGGTTADRLVWVDKSVTNLAKAKDADVYSYIAQNYDESPNLFVGGADLHDAKMVTDTNAFQSGFAWGRSETIDFTTDKGRALQGTLYYPAGYEAGKTYPMIVYVYETLSDNVHRYVVPTDRDYYNITVFMSQGYFVFEPDIVFRPRQPGLSVVECVAAGVKKVDSLGPVDPKRVGIVGHSWGGFDTAFLATHTNGVFAAAVAGAPITDLVSNYGNHHWSSGIAETDHIETGQQRMEVPLYEDLQDYVANSAVFNVANMTVPLLIEVGDADGTVFWHQGLELYNIARRAKKDVVLLEYEGEDHGLRQERNQVDYQQRILAWFGHYLKGETGPDWILHGESYLDRDTEVKKLNGGRGGQ